MIAPSTQASTLAATRHINTAAQRAVGGGLPVMSTRPPSSRAGHLRRVPKLLFRQRLFGGDGDAVLGRGKGHAPLHLRPVPRSVVRPTHVLHGPRPHHHVAPMLFPPGSCPLLRAVDEVL